MKFKFTFIVFMTLLASCTENYSPKPLGHHRIDFSEKEYQLFDSKCSYQFLRPKDAVVIKGSQQCWYLINYPTHNASLYLTYKKLNSDLANIIEESHKLAYDHAIRSDGIIEKVYANEAEKVFGVLYDIHGNSASNLQVCLTDSANHFLRGALYFNETPNADSLLPVKEYIKEDFITLMESLTWS